MGTALFKARFGDLAQQLVVSAASLHAATATTRTATSLTAGIKVTAHRAYAAERARLGASNDAAAPRTAAATLDSSTAGRACHDVVVALRPAPDLFRPTSPRRTALVRLAQDYLEANLDEPFSLRRLGAAARCSERMLQYAFREVCGMGPHAWFQAVKLKEANRELRTGRSQRRARERRRYALWVQPLRPLLAGVSAHVRGISERDPQARTARPGLGTAADAREHASDSRGPRTAKGVSGSTRNRADQVAPQFNVPLDVDSGAQRSGACRRALAQSHSRSERDRFASLDGLHPPPRLPNRRP